MERRTLDRLRTEAQPIRLAVLPLIAVALIAIYYYQAEFVVPAAIFAILTIVFPDLHFNTDRLSWTIGDGHLTAKSRNEDLIELGFFDVDQLFVLEHHYYFVASTEKITSWPAPNYSRGIRRFYIPFSAFESDDDRLYFESLFPDWKIKRK